MVLGVMGKLLPFLKLGCHQPQNSLPVTSLCIRITECSCICLGLFLLTEVSAVFQAIHASGKRSRNDSVRPTVKSSHNVVSSGMSLPDPLKDDGGQIVSHK